MKYAVIESGGKQYVVREGESIAVDRLPLEIGSKVQIEDLLYFANDGEVLVGTPTVKGGKVTGTVVEQFKAKKILVFKYIPKERVRRRRGHRQQYTRIAIDKISIAKPPKKAAEADPEAEKAPAKKAVKKAAPKKKDS